MFSYRTVPLCSDPATKRFKSPSLQKTLFQGTRSPDAPSWSPQLQIVLLVGTTNPLLKTSVYMVGSKHFCVRKLQRPSSLIISWTPTYPVAFCPLRPSHPSSIFSELRGASHLLQHQGWGITKAWHHKSHFGLALAHSSF